MDLQLLKTIVESEEFEGMNNNEIASILNEPAIEYWIEPNTADVQNFMFSNGMYMKLLAVYRDHEELQVRVAAEAAIDTVTGQIPQLNIHGNQNIQNMLALLVSKGVFTQQDADDLNAFPRRLKSRSENELGELVTENHIACAKLLDKLAEVEELIKSARYEVDTTSQLLNVKEAILREREAERNQLRAGIDVEVN